MESFRDHIRELEKTATRLRVDLLKMTHQAQIGFTGSALSVIDILVALYYGKLHDRPIMNVDPAKPGSELQDYFVLSKAHASPAWYSVLADKGFFAREELDYFSQAGSLLQAQPNKKIPGVFVGSGLPAQGFSGALGLALALQMDKQLNRVFCLISDGELQSGQIWESALAAAHYKLDNFTALIDMNDVQIDANTRANINVDPIADKFESFGWKTIPVRNGHDFEELLYAFERAFDVQRRPSVIIARTVKGKGVSFAENKASYNSALSEEEMAEALPRLEAELELP
jgi:transketolase